MKSTINKQQGLSLIELMIAVVLGLMILSSLGYILVGSHGTYRSHSASAHVMDTGRNAMNFIAYNIRVAGRAEITPLATDKRTEMPAGSVPITGTDGVGDGDPDTLVVNYQLSTLNGGSIEDCNGNGAAIAKSNILAANGSTLGQYGTVQNTINLNGTDLRCTGNGAVTPQPVAEGIEDLQFLYGVDTSGNDAVDSWLTASNVSNWSQVVAVQVCMMVRSIEDGVLDAAQTLTNCLGKSVTANDRRLRRVFTSVFVMRNRVNILPQ